MTIASFSGSPNSVYPDLIEALLQAPEVPSRNGITLELHPCMLELSNSRERLITSYGRPVNVAFALAEVLWILSGRRDVPMLQHYNKRISSWSDDGQIFNAPYGYRLRVAHGHDQLQDVIWTLRQDQSSRQAVLNVWLPSADRGWDIKSTDGTFDNYVIEPHRTEDRACNMLAHLMIRDGALDWLHIVRSNDAVWGLPYNLMQWTHLHEYVAEQVGASVGRLLWMSDSMHMYGSRTPGVAGDGKDDTSAWADAEDIRYFSLYKELNAQHRPMGLLSQDDLNGVMAYELQLRTDEDSQTDLTLDLLGASRLPKYWKDVLEILYAHKLYVQGRDKDALDFLMCAQDQIYALAQMRFYWSMRWSKQQDAERLKDELVSSYGDVGVWITNG